MKSLLPGLILLLFFQSCDCKPDCSNDDKIGFIRFKRYAETDIDSTKIVKYKKGTGLTVVIDTFFVDSSMVDEYTYHTGIDIPAKADYIDVNYDYKLILNAGIECTLTDFTLELEKSKCHIFSKGCWHYVLVSYKRNGKVVNISWIEIVK